MFLKTLASNIRFYVLLSSISLLISLFFFIKDKSLLIQLLALISVVYLYFTLLATPLTKTFTSLPFKGQYIKIRRALGVSAFLFGFIHGNLALLNNIGGLPGLFALQGKTLFAVLFGQISSFILLLMALTSNDFIINKFGFKKWKILHRLVYLVGFLILFHALILGSHFQNLSGFIPKIFLIALIFLLSLQAKRLYTYFKRASI